MYDLLTQAGGSHGLRGGGYRAIESMRLEKGYRAWGTDLTPETTPESAGVGFAVRLDKPVPFIGQDALRAEREEGGPREQLVSLVLEDARSVCLGSEPVRIAAELCGRVTSGGTESRAAQHRARLRLRGAAVGTLAEIEVFGEWVRAEVVDGALYDPAGSAFAPRPVRRRLLVDYHLHLAPDGAALGAAELSRDRVAQYADVASARGIGHVCLTEHCHRFRQAAGLLDHPFWHESAQADLDAYVVAVRSYGEPVACGIELDWIEGREDELGALVEDRDFDLVLGSVHWLGGLAVDHPDYAIWEDVAADEVWRRYFAQVRAAAASGLFDVLAHLDLAKVFGNAASRSVVESEHEDTADAIAAAGVAIEISTAGLRKAAGELYPAPGLLRALHRRGVPITLGSDGHVPRISAVITTAH